MTLQKPRTYRIIIFVAIGISVITIIIFSGQLNTCGIQHVTIIDDINKFQTNQDPEFCAITVNKILSYNEKCEPYIEILDCG